MSFLLNDDRNKMVVTTLHTVLYENKRLTPTPKKYLLDIFSDIRCSKDTPSQIDFDFHFDEIEIFDVTNSKDEKKIFRVAYDNVHGNEKEKLKTIKNSKLFWSYETSIPKNGIYKFSFKIHGEYEIDDRLVWTFQEVSDDATIIVRNTCPKCFNIKINHPNESMILHHNNDITEKGTLIKGMSEICFATKYCHTKDLRCFGISRINERRV